MTIASTGSGTPPPDPDNDINDIGRSKRLHRRPGNVVTKAINLTVGDEPVNGDHNRTLDAGFVAFDTLVAIGNLIYLRREWQRPLRACAG